MMVHLVASMSTKVLGDLINRTGQPLRRPFWKIMCLAVLKI